MKKMVPKSKDHNIYSDTIFMDRRSFQSIYPRDRLVAIRKNQHVKNLNEIERIAGICLMDPTGFHKRLMTWVLETCRITPEGFIKSSDIESQIHTQMEWLDDIYVETQNFTHYLIDLTDYLVRHSFAVRG